MFDSLLSHDPPRSRRLTLLLAAIVLGLAFAPFLAAGAPALDLAASVLVFIVLGASFDLLWGCAGCMSYAHTVFFGIGACGVALASAHFGPGWGALALGTVLALAASVLLSLLIGLVGWRANARLFAFVTLAFASGVAALGFLALASHPGLNSGDAGVHFELPSALRAETLHAAAPWLGASIDGRFARYGLLLCATWALFLVTLRIVNSPFGRALQAMRENALLAEAIGYRPGSYRTIAQVLSAAFATLAGVLLALWRGQAAPEAMLSFEIMFDVLLIVRVGGRGTMYGAVAGSVLVVLGSYGLQGLAERAPWPVEGMPTPWLWLWASAHRGLLWLLALLALSACPPPAGVVGRLRARGRSRRRGT